MKNNGNAKNHVQKIFKITLNMLLLLPLLHMVHQVLLFAFHIIITFLIKFQQFENSTWLIFLLSQLINWAPLTVIINLNVFSKLTGIIYAIHCRDCENICIDETGRLIEISLKKYTNAFKRGKLSSNIIQHSLKINHIKLHCLQMFLFRNQ